MTDHGPNYESLPAEILEILALAVAHPTTALGTAKIKGRDGRKLKIQFRVDGEAEAETLKVISGGRIRRATPGEPRTSVVVEGRRATRLLAATWRRLPREVQDRANYARAKCKASRTAA